MNRRGQLQVVMSIVVIALFALALIPSIFNAQHSMTDKTNVVNEVIDISGARLEGGEINTTYPFTITNYPDEQWRIDRCPISGVTYSNTSTDLALTTDYTFTDTTGVLLLLNTVGLNGTTGAGSNTTYIDYTWCQDGYNVDGGSRSMAGIIGLFSVLTLAVIIAGLGLKEWLSNR